MTKQRTDQEFSLNLREVQFEQSLSHTKLFHFVMVTAKKGNYKYTSKLLKK
jgi:hypothetical protein